MEMHATPLGYRTHAAVEMTGVHLRFFDKAARIGTDLH